MSTRHIGETSHRSRVKCLESNIILGRQVTEQVEENSSRESNIQRSRQQGHTGKIKAELLLWEN